MNFEIITRSEEETKKVAKQLATHIKKGDVITLEGDLGVGKTTFTKGLAKGLQVDRTVTSPTFTIVKEYEGRLPLYHIDAYRLEHSDEDIGLEEYVYGDGVSVIEWAIFIEDFLPKERLHISLERVGEKERKITLQAIGNDHYLSVVQHVKDYHQGV